MLHTPRISSDSSCSLLSGKLINPVCYDFQRLIPVDRGTDLYLYKAPDIPNTQTYTIRPYRTTDEAAVYKICTMTFRDGLSAADEFARLPDLPGDL